MRVRVAGQQGVHDGGAVGIRQEVVADLRHRRHVTQADAWRSHHPRARQLAAQLQLPQLGIQRLGPKLGARHGVAHADDGGGQRRVLIPHDVEMGVERRGLVNLGKRQAHRVRQGGQVRRGDLVVRVLDQVQMFDQQVARAGAVPQKGRDLMRRLG